jgi:hypothetical protein
MPRCEYCAASSSIRWFSPRDRLTHGAVLLCLACRRLMFLGPQRPLTAPARSAKLAA